MNVTDLEQELSAPEQRGVIRDEDNAALFIPWWQNNKCHCTIEASEPVFLPFFSSKFAGFAQCYQVAAGHGEM